MLVKPWIRITVLQTVFFRLPSLFGQAGMTEDASGVYRPFTLLR